ncbi:sigma-70 family RNA polymerase sigma factor [Streptococcus dentiloxodontae]
MVKESDFVLAYDRVRPIVLRCSRHYFLQLWELADMEQEAMFLLYKLLEKHPYLLGDIGLLRRYFKTAFTNHLNDEVRRQESEKRRFHKMAYEEISEVAYSVPSKVMDACDQIAYREGLAAYRRTLSYEEAEQLELLLEGRSFKGRKKMMKALQVYLMEFKQSV